MGFNPIRLRFGLKFFCSLATRSRTTCGMDITLTAQLVAIYRRISDWFDRVLAAMRGILFRWFPALRFVRREPPKIARLTLRRVGRRVRLQRIQAVHVYTPAA